MRQIQVLILNKQTVEDAEQMMVCAARLTQRGHKINNIDDFLTLYNKEYSEDTVKNMCKLPHPTIQKFGVINIVIVGASRRFLAQITRHQNEVKFMSASLQYSDYTDAASFTVPYSIIEAGPIFEQTYLVECTNAMSQYKRLIENGINNDAAGYLAPQGLRNVLIMSATPYQWKHMISQRSCNRNTKETQYVMLKVWSELYKLSPSMFSDCGPFCMKGACKEDKMSCGRIMSGTPDEILKKEFPKLYD